MMRPYRLISHSELQELTQYYNGIIEQWNNDYGLIPWSIKLTFPKQDIAWQKQLAIISAEQTLAFIDQNVIQAFNLVLFGENNSDFDAISEVLMLNLLNKLLKEPCSLSRTLVNSPYWLYKGSTCLCLLLSAQGKEIRIILNPQCIYDLLPSCKTKGSELSSVDEAIEGQRLQLNLELLPFKLCLGELSTLQIGDVITTDHDTHHFCRLTHKQQVLALADLGQSSLHKSIILKEFL